ncbi:hypothetical protein [Choristoneura occidentalis alphabaculovirus]|nr:hypothetical protein [Choristoneura occidentalis alphabaculovirus]
MYPKSECFFKHASASLYQARAFLIMRQRRPCFSSTSVVEKHVLFLNVRERRFPSTSVVEKQVIFRGASAPTSLFGHERSRKASTFNPAFRARAFSKSERYLIRASARPRFTNTSVL